MSLALKFSEFVLSRSYRWLSLSAYVQNFYFFLLLKTCTFLLVCFIGPQTLLLSHACIRRFMLSWTLFEHTLLSKKIDLFRDNFWSYMENIFFDKYGHHSGLQFYICKQNFFAISICWFRKILLSVTIFWSDTHCYTSFDVSTKTYRWSIAVFSGCESDIGMYITTISRLIASSLLTKPNGKSIWNSCRINYVWVGSVLQYITIWREKHKKCLEATNLSSRVKRIWLL